MTKSAAAFLVLVILSPVTAPFASFPLSILLTHQTDTHASVAVTQSDASAWAPANAGTVLVEEQTKDGEVILDSRPAIGATFDGNDLPLEYRSTAVERRQTRFVVLRV